MIELYYYAFMEITPFTYITNCRIYFEHKQIFDTKVKINLIDLGYAQLIQQMKDELVRAIWGMKIIGDVILLAMASFFLRNKRFAWKFMSKNKK